MQQQVRLRNPKRLRINKQIGEGSFGRVYLALDLDNGLPIAVKQVPLSTFGDSKAAINRVETLEKEIELLQALKHKHIVRYLGSRRDT